MPLIHVYMMKGRSNDAIRQTLDAIHRAVVSTFMVPVRDRYQIVQECDPAHMVIEDTGLGLARSERVVLIHVVSRARTQEAKVQFYRAVCAELEGSCEIAPNDVVTTFTTNGDADWSFGMGQAQFLTGEL